MTWSFRTETERSKQGEDADRTQTPGLDDDTKDFRSQKSCVSRFAVGTHHFDHQQQYCTDEFLMTWRYSHE